MADTASVDVLISGQNIYHVRLHGVSDGTGESDVVKIDRSALIGPDGVNPPSSIKIMNIQYDIQGHAQVTLEWDGTADAPIGVLSGQGYKDFERSGGLTDDSSGATGDVILTSSATVGGTYDIILECRLKQ